MTAPYRIQRKRVKDWKKPENAVNCTRPSLLCNPWGVRDSRAFVMLHQSEAAIETPIGLAQCIYAFRWWLQDGKVPPEWWPTSLTAYGEQQAVEYLKDRREKVLAAIPNLTGKALMCYCAPDKPCHCDVLIDQWRGMQV